MLNYAELNLDTDLNDHYRAQTAPDKSPQIVSESRRFMCRIYRIKPWQSQFLSQNFHKDLHTQLKIDSQQVMQSQALSLTSKTTFKVGLSPSLPDKPINSPSLKDLLFDMQTKQTRARQAIFLTPPLSQAIMRKVTFERAGESSQSYRGIYEQKNFNQCHARRRGLGNLCGKWYS